MRPALLRLLASVAFLSAFAPGAARADSQGPIIRFAVANLGNIDVRLLPAYAPNTVTNFLKYVNSGAYGTTFLHRSVTASPTNPFDIIQGGSFDVVNGQRGSVATNSPIPLEYNLPNARGTLAMARGTDPNSATSGWFFNVTDDTSTFGPSNAGGYAVFGQVLDPASLKVMDAIAAQRIVDDSQGTSSSPYGQLPTVNYAGASPAPAGAITPSNLIMSPVTILNDTTAPTVTITQPTTGELFTQGQALTPQYTCNDGANGDGTAGTGVASCTSSAVDLTTPGSKTFTVSTTDYAGNATTKSVAYTVNPAPPAPVPIVTPPAPRRHVATPVAPSVRGSLTASRSGNLAFTLRCTTGARCTGSISLAMAAAHNRTVRVASGRYAIAGRRTVKFTLHLGSVTTKRLRARRHLALALTLAPTGGRQHTQRVTLHLGTH